MRFADIDGCPVPTELEPTVRALRQHTGATLNSCYRGTDPAAAGILRAHGKHTQAYLYEHQHDPGFYPANPPGRSTHECRSDGVAYPGPLGRHLAGWQCGMDWPDSQIEALMHAGRQLGLLLIHPYPSGLEYHHLNLGRKPRLAALWLPIRAGSRGPHVRMVTAKLRTLGYLHRPHYVLSSAIAHGAVTKFQVAHHLHPDGVIGPHTYLTLNAAWRAHQRRRRRSH